MKSDSKLAPISDSTLALYIGTVTYDTDLNLAPNPYSNLALNPDAKKLVPYSDPKSALNPDWK